MTFLTCTCIRKQNITPTHTKLAGKFIEIQHYVDLTVISNAFGTLFISHKTVFLEIQLFVLFFVLKKVHIHLVI